MWGVYPEAMACNVGGLCSNFILCEGIFRKSPGRPNLKVHFEIRPSGTFSQDTLPQNLIWAQSSNIAGLCLWIDTPHTCLCLDDINFSILEGPGPGVRGPGGADGKVQEQSMLYKKKFSITLRTNKNTGAFFVSTLASLLKRASDHGR